MNLDNHLVFLGCTDLAEVRKFYADVLGFAFVADEGGTYVFDLGNTELRISQVPYFKPQAFTVLGWMVDDIDEKVRQLKAKGIALIRYPNHFEHDELGIARLEGVRIAWFNDPAGNNLSLSQRG